MESSIEIARVRKQRLQIQRMGFSIETARSLLDVAGEKLAFEVARWTKCATGGYRYSTPWETVVRLISRALGQTSKPSREQLGICFKKADPELPSIPTISPEMVPAFLKGAQIALLAM